MKHIISYIVGLTFGFGISISGMANPAKVLNFFDFAGSWDPSLAFVMAGGLVVTFIGYKYILAKPSPLLMASFELPKAKRIDPKLIGGSATFGIGWGIAGFCPGGALPALGTGQMDVIIFCISMIAGIVLTKVVLTFSKSKLNLKIQ